MGDNWTDTIHRDDLSRCLETCTQAFNHRRPSRRVRLRRNVGEYRWILDTGAPGFAAATFEGYVGVRGDVTDSSSPRSPYPA